jgi:hypothetical protein
MVGIGMISYPLYLWHWPLLSFARIVTKPTATVKFALVGLSLVLAWATWRFVELKLRDRGRRKGVSADIPAFSIGLAFTCLLGAVFFESNALARRVTTDFGELAVDLAEPNTLSKYVDGPPEVQGLHFNLQSKPGHPDAVVVGDSHARTLLDGLAAVDRRRTWLAMGGYGCPPAVNIPVVHSALPRPCEMITKRVYEYLAEPSSPGLVVLAFYGYYSEATDLAPVDVNDYMRPSLLRIGESTAQAAKEEALFAGLDRSVQLLVEHHKRVLLVIDGPELPFLPRDCIKRPYLTNYATCSIETSAVEQRQQGLRRIVRRLQERAPSLEIFDTVPLLCDRLQCAPVVAGFSYYRDNNHLSLRGSEKIAAAVLNAIDHAGPTARSAGLMNSVR